MRSVAHRESDRRWFAVFMLAFVLFLIILTTGCVKQFVHDPLYDQTLLDESPADSATYVRIRIENNRTTDGLDPHFYLQGAGTHSLGVVRGYGGSVTRFIDTAWFDSDRCMQIIAHYVGGGNWVSQKFCYRKGEFIDVKLQNIMSTSSAWSHR